MSTVKLTIRQPEELKLEVEQAAAKCGMTVTSFINHTLARAARRTLREVRERELTERDQRALLELLADPPAPSENLRAAVREYQERAGG